MCSCENQLANVRITNKENAYYYGATISAVGARWHDLTPETNNLKENTLSLRDLFRVRLFVRFTFLKSVILTMGLISTNINLQTVGVKLKGKAWRLFRLQSLRLSPDGRSMEGWFVWATVDYEKYFQRCPPKIVGNQMFVLMILAKSASASCSPLSHPGLTFFHWGEVKEVNLSGEKPGAPSLRRNHVLLCQKFKADDN